MQRKVTKLENCRVQVEVTVDTKTWKEAKEKAFKKEAANVSVPGFRKGKAPENMVKGRVDQARVLDNAVNALLPVIYADILKEEKIDPFAKPSVDVTDIKEDSISVKFIIPVFPTIELGNYKGLKIGKKEANVEDKEVEETINNILKNNASLVIKEGAANKGDTINLDFVGKVDGVAFEGGSATNYELELGSNSFIPGFEDQLIGVKPGETRDINVTFPENYTPELKGKAATFTCTVHEVKEKKLPELNDEFVKEQKIKDVETVEAYKNYQKENLLKNKIDTLRNEFIGKVLEEVAKTSKISMPEEAVNQQTESRKNELIQQMKQSGLTYEQYLTFVKKTDEAFTATIREQSIKSITNYLIVDAIAKAENIVIGDKDVDEEYASLAKQYNMPVENVKKALEAQLEQFKENLRGKKAEDIIYNSNN